MVRIGPMIVARIKELGLTQSEVARRSNLTAAITKYIQDVIKPTYENILVLSKILEVHPAFFFPDDPHDPLPGSRLQRTVFTPTPKVADETVFPAPSRKFSRGGMFVIGHYLPTADMPPPTQMLTQGTQTKTD